MAESQDPLSLLEAKLAELQHNHGYDAAEMEQMIKDFQDGKLNLTAQTACTNDDEFTKIDIDIDIDNQDSDDEEYCSDNEEYCSDEYYDEEDIIDLPQIVLDEINRRRDIKQQQQESSSSVNEEPPKPEIIKALREHFLLIEAVSERGAFIRCMQQIGGTPSAKDPLVYEPKYNVCKEDLLMFNGENADKWISEHEAQVRLFRYRELIDDMAQKGIRPGQDWVLKVPNDDKFEMDDEDFFGVGCKDELTMEQIVAFGGILSMGWYRYTNFDNLWVGQGVGAKETIPMDGGEFKFQPMDISEDILIEQCLDMEQRYDEMRCPLGPELVFKECAQTKKEKKKNKKGKKNRGRKGNSQKEEEKVGLARKPHFGWVVENLTQLFVTVDEKITESDASSQFVYYLANSLANAVRFDPAVASALVDKGESECGSLVLKLYAKTTKVAKEAKGVKSKERKWMLASTALFDVLALAIQTLFEHMYDDEEGGVVIKDESGEEDAGDGTDFPVCTFFFKKMLPVILAGMQSDHVHEKDAAFQALTFILAEAPPSICKRFIEKKGTWTRIETACRISLNECTEAGALKTEEVVRSSSFENFMKHATLTSAAKVLHYLCGKSFTFQENQVKFALDINVSDMALKMVKRGVIPLLMDIAKADIGRPSNEAMEALGAISRVKDCRTIMLQDDIGVELVKKALSSTDARMVSPALLLILHLLWDEEWAAPLSSIDPPLVLTTIRWGLFAMDSLIKRAKERKKEREECWSKHTTLFREYLSMDEGEARKRKELEANEELKKLPVSEFQLETEKHRAPLDFFLGRCLLVLGVSCKLESGADQMLESGGLSFFSSCLDIPIRDCQNATVAGLQNTLLGLGMKAISPLRFNDPAHLIRAAIILIDRLVNEDDKGPLLQMLSIVLVKLRAEGEWDPYFDQLPTEYKLMADVAIPRGYKGSADGISRNVWKSDVSAACAVPTGKLRSCDACGKLETKRGSLSKCSGCYEVSYCSRECQIDHWRKGHKKHCKKARK